MKKSFLSFIVIVLALASLMAVTTPLLLKNTRIGLEFKGGYEILYVAQPEDGTVDKAALLKTAEILGSRANKLGVAEPDVIVEGNNQIRVKLAGVSSNEEVRAIINQAGLLPVKLTEKYSQTVGGVLGQADLHNTLRAGVIALILILLFMGLVYRVPGLVAIFSLITYLWLLLVVFNILHATLSLAAIVAFVLGIGIASDANILSYERIKEELRKGKPILLALKDGESYALRTIIDSNMTGMIGAIVLFAVGIGPIRGFALTMILSILISLVCNVFLARLLLNLLTQSNLKSPAFFGVKKVGYDQEVGFNFVKYRNLFFAISTIFALAGTVTLITSPLNLDIDFKAGTALDVAIKKPINQEQATSIMEDAGIAPATVAIGGNGSNQIAARFDNVLNATQINQIIGAFKQEFGNVAFQENTSDPVVAQQLVVKAIYAISFAIVGIFIFVTLRFEWRFAIAATIAILNSAFFVLSMFAIFKYEIDVTFIAAILTVIGYSVNDTIVIFDRIRENLHLSPVHTYRELADLVNQSIWQTLRRSIYTVLTVVTGAICLYYFGAEPLQMFSLAIFFGLICGAYSSIFIAAQIWLLFKGNSLPTDVENNSLV